MLGFMALGLHVAVAMLLTSIVGILPWTVARVSANPPFYREAFAEACAQAVAEDGAGAVIIGGGPLSGIADEIAGELPVPVLDGVRCAVTMALASSIETDDGKRGSIAADRPSRQASSEAENP